MAGPAEGALSRPARGVEYRLTVRDPHSHLLEVEVRVSGIEGALELAMPSWTPGSYLLREYPRLVQDLSARSGEDLELGWSKTDKNTWRIDSGAAPELIVRYRVYANELSVRTSHLDGTHAFVTGASVFMMARGREDGEHRVTLDVPDGWRASVALPERDGAWIAGTYDELVDSPFEIGAHALLEWEQDGVPHTFAIWGVGPVAEEEVIEDTRRIVAAAAEMFGGLPYDRYLFIVHLLAAGRGGLEHAASTALQVSRDSMAGRRGAPNPTGEYESFLALVAHEFFHVWNAKRIRPEALGPFDYTRENHTRDLWIVEGFTTYYTDLLLVRAGLMTRDRYLERLGEAIARFEALPGRAHQSLADASFDTWIKFYRPDEHTPNSQISYYQKGALVALLLDLEIRRATDHDRSLDDVLRALWARFLEDGKGFPETGPGSVLAMAEEVSGVDLGEFFRRYVEGTGPLEYDRYLEVVGLRVGAGAPDSVAQESRLGIRIADAAAGVRVTHVLAGSTAATAGLYAADDLVAMDGFRIPSAAALRKRLALLDRERRVTLSLFRRDQLISVEVEVGAGVPGRVKLVGEGQGVERWLGPLRGRP